MVSPERRVDSAPEKRELPTDIDDCLRVTAIRVNDVANGAMRPTEAAKTRAYAGLDDALVERHEGPGQIVASLACAKLGCSATCTLVNGDTGPVFEGLDDATCLLGVPTAEDYVHSRGSIALLNILDRSRIET